MDCKLGDFERIGRTLSVLRCGLEARTRMDRRWPIALVGASLP